MKKNKKSSGNEATEMVTIKVKEEVLKKVIHWMRLT